MARPSRVLAALELVVFFSLLALFFIAATGCLSGPSFGGGGGGGGSAPIDLSGPAETVNSMIGRIIGIVPVLVIGVIAAWALAFWQPWFPVAAAIGVSAGLLGIMALIYLASYLAAYGHWIVLVAAVVGVYLLWPTAIAWRNRSRYHTGRRLVEAGKVSEGMEHLEKLGRKVSNGDGTVRVGRKKIKIGAADG